MREALHKRMLSVQSLPNIMDFSCSSFIARSKIFRITKASSSIRNELLFSTSVRVATVPLSNKKAVFPSSRATTSKTSVTKGCLMSLRV